MLALGLLLSFVLVTGCGGGTVTGYAKTVPQAGSPVVVISADRAFAQAAAQATRTWLQERGVNVVERAVLQRIMDEQRFVLLHTNELESDRSLKVGQMQGAAQFVVIETNLYSDFASIRGVSVQTGEVLWTASYASRANFPSDAAVTSLTRAALDKAWSAAPEARSGGREQEQMSASSPERGADVWKELEQDTKLRAAWCGLGAVAQWKDPALYADLCPNSH